jgi:hypothetical protein
MDNGGWDVYQASRTVISRVLLLGAQNMSTTENDNRGNEKAEIKAANNS